MSIQDDLYLPRAQGQPEPSRVRIGLAEADISPEPGMELPGGYVKAYAHKIHDPCKIRAAVFADAQQRLAVVSVDALLVPRPLVQAARRRIEQRCGIAAAGVMIAATHSHSSGPLGMVLPGEFDHASSLVQKLAYEYSSCADPRYLQRVEDQIVAAVASAHDKLAPARLSFGNGHEDAVAFNRRFKMKNGLTYTHPGRGHPDIVGPAGPIDPAVGVIGIWDDHGALKGCVVNYACHATTGPEAFSANWIYYLEQTIRASLGPEAIVLFLQGASGDITQVNNQSPYVEPSDDASARRVGGSVGAEAVKVLLQSSPGGNVSLEAHRKMLTIPRRAPSAERVQRSLEIVRRSPEEAGHTEWVFAKEIVLLDALLAKNCDVEVELQALRLGPAVLLGNPAELFVEWGLAMKAGSPLAFTFPVELANGCIGYVPTEAAFGPHGGGYETRLTAYSNLAHSAGREMLDGVKDLLAALKPDPAPQPPLAPPATATWSYGSVPPE